MATSMLEFKKYFAPGTTYSDVSKAAIIKRILGDFTHQHSLEDWELIQAKAKLLPDGAEKTTLMAKADNKVAARVGMGGNVTIKERVADLKTKKVIGPFVDFVDGFF